MGKTSIEWTDYSRNPIRARNRETGKTGHFCIHASPGCAGCYAETMNHRLGTGVDFKAQNADQVEVYLDEKALREPLKWKKPRVIFTCSMTDLFGEFVVEQFIARVWAIMARCPQHTFIVLTKRAERMRQWIVGPGLRQMELARHFPAGAPLPPLPLDTHWPLTNVWLGVSAEDQRRWDERVPELRATPAALRLVSVEPQIEYIDAPDLSGLHWIINGGESGPGARAYHLEWGVAFSTWCALGNVAFMQKQVGANPYWAGVRLHITDKKGGDMGEWPSCLRIRNRPPTVAERFAA